MRDFVRILKLHEPCKLNYDAIDDSAVRVKIDRVLSQRRLFMRVAASHSALTLERVVSHTESAANDFLWTLISNN